MNINQSLEDCLKEAEEHWSKALLTENANPSGKTAFLLGWLKASYNALYAENQVLLFNHNKKRKK